MSLAENLLRVCKENRIEEVLKESDSWEMLYHLSPMRYNLLEWVEFKKDAVILEVGAQAGGLTSFFANRVKNVVALEKDMELLAVNKYRTKAMSNIDFRAGGMNAIKKSEKFDCINWNFRKSIFIL